MSETVMSETVVLSCCGWWSQDGMQHSHLSRPQEERIKETGTGWRAEPSVESRAEPLSGDQRTKPPEIESFVAFLNPKESGRLAPIRRT